jgi:purine-binding chemotaxis protein CheW
MTRAGPDPKEGASLLRQALAEAGALPPKDTRESTAVRAEFVHFTIHDQHYALPTKQVSAILRSPALTELPHAPPHLCGVVSHQGRIVAVIDIAILDGKEPVTSATRILIIEGAGLDAGIRVSNVIELARVDATAVEPLSASLSPPEHIVGQLRRGDVLCFVMDAERLLARVRQRVKSTGANR